MGWLIRRFWDVVLIAALLALMGGAALMQSAAGTGGNALGQAISGGFTCVKAIAGGFKDADAVGDALKRETAQDKSRDKSRGKVDQGASHEPSGDSSDKASGTR
jgi:hypothetical protein